MYYVDSLFVFTTKLSPGIIVKVEGHTFKGVTTKEIRRILNRGKVLRGITQEQFWQQAHKMKKSS